MLPFFTVDIYKYLSNKPVGQFSVYHYSEISEATGKTTETVIDALSVLRSEDYITVKYSDKNEICLSVTEKLNNEYEGALKSFVERERDKKSCFLWAFFGGVVGTLSVGIVLIILRFTGLT